MHKSQAHGSNVYADKDNRVGLEGGPVVSHCLDLILPSYICLGILKLFALHGWLMLLC